MKNLLWSVLVGVGLVGCATPQYNYAPAVTQISKPPIGSEATAYVGDQMLVQGKFIKRTALFLSDPIRISFAYTMLGGYYPKTGEDANGVYYGIGGIQNAGNIQKSAIADPYKAVMVTPDNKLCVITVFNAKNCTQIEKEKIVNQEVDSLSENSFQQTLIYSGRVGNKINVGYREFSSNLARPAFNNDVEYDLNESKTIGYKGALLEVIEATNQFIKYKVIKNFNMAQE
ncbi:hypothetical protein [Alkanindiges illinoisensis]|uniref:hypothetical protein n=1 Tax=Alkanindiges illinoisensis TaxID=197183 RepID=UPI00047D8914|nr:hypothetical protein [Alkanindiges illinoisensis]